MSFDLSELLARSRPPDLELASVIDQAYLEGQIDGVRAELAYAWLEAKNGRISAKTLPQLLP